MTHKKLKPRWQENLHFPFIDVCHLSDPNITSISETILLWDEVLNVSENKHFQVAVFADCRSEKCNSRAIQWTQGLNKFVILGPFQGGILAESRKIHPSIQKN